MKEIVINNMLIINDIIILIIAFVLHWLVAYFTKKGSNNADKEDMRDISYQSKKGSNVADEEDQISQTQKERLIKVLYLTEKINQSSIKYFLYFYDHTSRVKFDRLVEDLNSLLPEVYHEQMLANLFLPKEGQEILDNLMTCITGIIAELSTHSTNAASLITMYNELLQLARENKHAEKLYWDEALKVKKQFDELEKTELRFKDDLKDAIQRYVDWLGKYIKQNIRTINEDVYKQ